MESVKAVFVILFGLCIGSFLNVAIYRIPRRESVSEERSHCPKCGHPLAAKDLVPVLSWVVLRGKCRYCGAPISLRYPLVELAGAMTAYGAYLLAGPTWKAVALAVAILAEFVHVMIRLDSRCSRVRAPYAE